MVKLSWTSCALAAAGLLVGGLSAGSASAADLGGNCCTDLEERIAELEATTARKGNRKVSVTISGVVNKAFVYTDFEDYNDWSIGDNSNDPTRVRISGAARISGNWTAGFLLELGLGGYEGSLASGGYGHLEGDTNGVYTRQSYVYIKNSTVGSVVLGKAPQATEGITLASTANTLVASQPGTLRPITGDGIGEVIEMDGTRANVVRYDSPTLAGFVVSASVAAANTDLTSGDSDGNIWDVALRYAGEFGNFKVAAGIGYREGVYIEDDSALGLPISIGIDGDPKVWSGSASVMHVPSGIFVSGMYGNQDWSFGGASLDFTGYGFQAGVENKFLTTMGDTTVYGEWFQWDVDPSFAMSWEPSYWGGGIVQSIDAAALDLYVSGRQYDLDLPGVDDATVVMGGARIQF